MARRLVLIGCVVAWVTLTVVTITTATTPARDGCTTPPPYEVGLIVERGVVPTADPPGLGCAYADTDSVTQLTEVEKPPRIAWLLWLAVMLGAAGLLVAAVRGRSSRSNVTEP